MIFQAGCLKDLFSNLFYPQRDPGGSLLQVPQDPRPSRDLSCCMAEPMIFRVFVSGPPQKSQGGVFEYVGLVNTDMYVYKSIKSVNMCSFGRISS